MASLSHSDSDDSDDSDSSDQYGLRDQTISSYHSNNTTISPERKRKMVLNRDANSTESSDDSETEPPVKQGRFDDGQPTSSLTQMKQMGNYSDFSSKMMMKMGYKAGEGLGKEGQGRVDIVQASQQKGRRGLGLRIRTEDKEVVVDWTDEKPASSKEEVEWMSEYTGEIPDEEELEDWITDGKQKLKIDDETRFCDRKTLQTLLTCKSIFDDLEGFEMRKARSRSNPYELIKGAIFLNRAAMKMANMDHCFNYMFTAPKGLQPNQLLYFADVCAGPGGFSEYVLWRKKWKSKGFGFTLKGNNDFKLNDFFAANSELFEPHYGVGGKDGTGDIMNGQNLEEFQRFVHDNTDDEGVHFVMADGGFSVEGQENIQEILTKQLLLCQFACALSILREEGSFVCKTFDLFTPFSVGLVYLLRIAFRRVAIFKPVTSRPANSERYVVCEGYRDPGRRIGNYLLDINEALNGMKNTGRDVTEVVPFEIMSEDIDFINYFKRSNESLADQQCKALAKIHAFYKNSELMESTQNQMRTECLKLWSIPDRVRAAPPRSDAASLFKKLTGLDDPTSLINGRWEELRMENIKCLERVYNYKCYVSGSQSSLIVSMGGSRVFYWNPRAMKWSHLTQVKCNIPRDTILEVEIVDELKGEGKSQRRSCALHVVDGVMLAGDDISSRNFSERAQCIAMFVKAITKPTLPYLSIVRAKQIHRLEEIDQVFTRMSMRHVKGGGQIPRLCCNILGTDLCFLPSGLTFIKFCKDPWSMAFSRSRKQKYFYNERTRQSVFECPPDFNANYQLCASTRVIWPWGGEVKIHPNQQRHRADLVSADQISQFVASHTAH
uniref:Cap-specific mRNA (nucleoside-2'-O-)-methyltransferase 1 n=1 Tax=Phallusia mammillata TaxID=59560 RepID=A0A6F9DAE6_9ASCI|nr:cap-specific mRNA (nucleoside-2'-O-)-methyltransferase 1 [Phallusia mammillata]